MRPASIVLLLCWAVGLPGLASTSKAAEETTWSQTVADDFLGPYVMLVPTGRLGRPTLVVAPNDGVFPTQLPTDAEAEAVTFDLDVAPDGTVKKATRTSIREITSLDNSYDVVAEFLRQLHFRPLSNGRRLTSVPIIIASAPNFAAATIRYPNPLLGQDIRIRLTHNQGGDRSSTSGTYTVEVNKTGSIIYKGDGNLPVTGERRAQISVSDAAGLIKNLTTATPFRGSRGRRSFHSWNDDTITISFGGKDIFLTSQMNIAGLYGASPDQRDLMTSLLVRATGAEQWIVAKPPPQSPASRVELAADLGNEALVRDLVSRGAPVSPAALASAAGRMGSADLARTLVTKGAPASDAIVLALERGDFEAVETLLSINAKLSRPTLTRAMLIAATIRRLDLVNELVRAGADTKGLNDRGENLLMRAASVGDSSLVTYALEKGLDPKAKSKGEGRTALHCTVGPNRQSQRVEAIKLLLKGGADINAADNIDATPLMRANRYEQLTAVLLASGADVNARSRSGKTALTLGCPTPAVARALIAAGARIRAQSELSELYHRCWFDPKTRESAKDVIEALSRQLQ